MQTPSTRSLHLSEWQKNYFDITSGTCTPSQNADALRAQILRIQYALANSEISQACATKLFRKYSDKYSAIIDSDNAVTGVNNYAENILTMARCQQTDSGKWQSGLTINNVFKLNSVQEMMQAGRKFKDSLLAPADASVVICNEVSAFGFSKPKSHCTEQTGIPKKPASLTHPQNSQLPLMTKTTDDSLVSSVPLDELPDSLLASADTSVVTHKEVSAFSFSKPKSHCTEQTGIPRKPASLTHQLPSMNKTTDDFPVSSVSLDELPSAKCHGTPLFGNARMADDTTKANMGVLNKSSNQHFLNSGYGNPGKKNTFYASGNDGMEGLSNPTLNKTLSNTEANGHRDESSVSSFKTAKEQLWINQQKKTHQPQRAPGFSYGGVKKSLGAGRSRGIFGKFVPPVAKQDGRDEKGGVQCKPVGAGPAEPAHPVDERLKNLEPKMIELIMNEIMDHGPPVNWEDIAGVEFAKTTIKEIVVWPMLRPDIFTGLRGPPKGILLFGPPGTGKTLIGKCIASQSGATFFSISASSLTSKWVGEGEKMVRALFAVARCQQPAVIFIDEIDSLLSQRGDGEHESSRRIKTEFLIQLDGAATSSEERILVVGATNRPQEIDEAARRRLVKRLYIPLPEASARKQIVKNLMAKEHFCLNEEEMSLIVQQSDGFSGADMTQLCREASLGPIRSLQSVDIATVTPDQVRPIAFVDFENAFRTVRPSVSLKDLELYENWNKTFGCGK